MDKRRQGRRQPRGYECAPRRVSGRAGRKAPDITLVSLHGIAYVRAIDNWYSGIAGLYVHRIPEDPEVYTVSTWQGLRIGRSRFPSVQAACELLQEVFGATVDFTLTSRELPHEFQFKIRMHDFIEKAQQVDKNMKHVTRITDPEEITRVAVDRQEQLGTKKKLT